MKIRSPILWSVLLYVLAAVAVVSCSKFQEAFVPKPRSLAATPTEVWVDAWAWVARDPANRFAAAVAATHSMEPVINEHSIVLMVRYTGQPFADGAVLCYEYSEQLPFVLHVATNQTADSVFMSGYNNSRSDGWQKKSSIKGVLVGQLYLP